MVLLAHATQDPGSNQCEMKGDSAVSGRGRREAIVLRMEMAAL